jgi:glutaredoxin
MHFALRWAALNWKAVPAPLFSYSQVMSREAVRSVIVITIAITFALVGVSSACHKAAPPAPEQQVQASTLPAIKVQQKAKKMLFTFVKSGESFETVDAEEKVPKGRRGWVRVVDLRKKPGQRQDHELVYVADLRKAEQGIYPYLVMSRRAFEAAAINRIKAGVTAPVAKPGGAKGVVLYATQWCGACRSARQWLDEQGIAYVEKDIEKDPSAADELLRKAKTAGISASGVPVLDINGTLVQGFDPGRIKSLLGDKKR